MASSVPMLASKLDWRLDDATAGSLMHRHVVTATPDTPSLDMILLMARHRINVLPVLDASRRVLGMVSRGDIVRRSDCQKASYARCIARAPLAAPAAESWLSYLEDGGKPAREVMTPDLVAVAEETPLETLCQLMQGHCITCLPVLRSEELVGIVARQDLWPA